MLAAGILKTSYTYTHRLHVWYIYLHVRSNSTIHVSKNAWTLWGIILYRVGLWAPAKIPFYITKDRLKITLLRINPTMTCRVGVVR